jgi:dTDP-4-amino-4,6-dideoxygalactose transaminase
LKYVDAEIKARQKVHEQYIDLLSDLNDKGCLILPEQKEYSSHVFHQYTLRVPGKRDALKKYLEERGIPTMIYYPLPLYLQNAFKNVMRYDTALLKESEKACMEVLSLPMHPYLEKEEIEIICTSIHSFFQG